jgi:serine O-acetyltransferase
MRASEFFRLVRSDLHRYAGNSKLTSFLYHYFFSPGFRFSYWLRKCSFSYSHPMARFIIFPFNWLILNSMQYKYGFNISFRTRIGSGFYLGHVGGIVVNDKVVIGKNCNLSHQVTLGISNRGSLAGTPTIGDNVYIGPGAKIFGRIHIGDYAAIGANCVVTKDVPDQGVVAGIPGKVISLKGSTGYINKVDYK